MTTDDVTVPPPPAVPGELIEAAAAALAQVQNPNCSPDWPNACEMCDCFRDVAGQSMAGYEREHAAAVLAAVYGDIVEAARRDALAEVERALYGMTGRSSERDDALDEALAAVTDLAEHPVASLSATHADGDAEKQDYADIRDAWKGAATAAQARAEKAEAELAALHATDDYQRWARAVAERDAAREQIARVRALCQPGGYTTWDADEKLPNPPYKPDDPAVVAWEKAHGHDMRLKCYPEFGCQLLLDPEDVLAALEGGAAT